jgi:hypothetical protein
MSKRARTGPRHTYTTTEIENLAKYYIESGFNNTWTEIFDQHKSDFKGVDGNKLGQFAARWNLNLCKTVEEVNQWKERILRNKTKTIAPLAQLEQQGMKGSNLNTIATSSSNLSSFSSTTSSPPLNQNTMVGPLLVKDIISKSGLLVAPYSAEFDNYIEIAWDKRLLGGTKIDLTVFENEIKIKSTQKPISTDVCKSFLSHIPNITEKINEKDADKIFSVPQFTKTSIKLPFIIDDQNFERFNDKDGVGIVLKKKIVGKTFSFEDDKIKELEPNKDLEENEDDYEIVDP